MPAIYDLEMTSITGDKVPFSDYQGQALLVVNLASQCGLTPQYTGLCDLQNSRDDLTVLGFPCNQFGKQEPGTDAEIAEFASSRYQVNFPLFSKVEVNGGNTCDLYKLLKAEKAQPDGNPDIAWNFTKFLVSKDGKVLARYEPQTTPEEVGTSLNDLLG